MRLIKFSPITQKRLHRFRKSRVAFFSFCMIIVLGIISFLAPLLCNDKPLYLRYNGQSFLPFLNTTPPEAIIEAAGSAQVDYKEFVASDVFKNGQNNWALFPLIPYGPGEVLNTESFDSEKKATLTIRPDLPIGRFDLTRDGRVVRTADCEPFFENANLAIGETLLKDHWLLDEKTEAEVALRFSGEPREAFTGEMRAASGGENAQTILLNMPALPQAGHAVKTVRFSISFPYDKSLETAQLQFKRLPDGTIEPTDKKKWETFNAEDRALFTGWIEKAFEKELVNETITYRNHPAQAITTIQTITWPFPPSRKHLMGVDAAGRDVMARILYGMRTSLAFGFLLATWATIIGMLYGSIQGYFAGKLDIGMQRFVEIWSALPFLYIMVLVGDLWGRKFSVLLLCYGIFNWISLSLYMRGEFLRLRNRPFVDAARCQGLSDLRIIFRHILPNALTPMITLFPFSLVGAIASLVALDFLGFGLPPLTPSWGELLQQAQQYRWAWWLILFPVSALFSVMFLTVLVGEGVRNAFDPKPYSKME